MFIKQYTKLIDDREKADDESEKNKTEKTLNPYFGYPIEKHAAKIYTSSVFKLFKAEMWKSSSYVIVNNSEGASYDVKHVDAENRDAWSRVIFTITADRDRGHYKCECRLYEHFGIIYCHIMLVMVQTGLMEILECHIMKRWTIQAREGWFANNGLDNYSVQIVVSRTIRHKNLYMNGLDLVSVGEYDDTTADLDVKYIEIAKKKISKYKKLQGVRRCNLVMVWKLGYDCPPRRPS